MKTLLKFQKKPFSIIHNYHCPPILYKGVREYVFDEDIREYNPYIQAFLTKRFIHKKEISKTFKFYLEPKITILNTLPEYHNSLYIQNMCPIGYLLELETMNNMYSLDKIDSSYVISRFTEPYEKGIYEAMVSKILINGYNENNE